MEAATEAALERGTLWVDPVTARDDGLVDWVCAVCGNVNEGVEPAGLAACGGDDCSGGFDFDFYTPPPPIPEPVVYELGDPALGDCVGCTEAENREFEAKYPELFEIDRKFRLSQLPDGGGGDPQ